MATRLEPRCRAGFTLPVTGLDLVDADSESFVTVTVLYCIARHCNGTSSFYSTPRVDESAAD